MPFRACVDAAAAGIVKRATVQIRRRGTAHKMLWWRWCLCETLPRCSTGHSKKSNHLLPRHLREVREQLGKPFVVEHVVRYPHVTKPKHDKQCFFLNRRHLMVFLIGCFGVWEMEAIVGQATAVSSEERRRQCQQTLSSAACSTGAGVACKSNTLIWQ